MNAVDYRLQLAFLSSFTEYDRKLIDQAKLTFGSSLVTRNSFFQIFASTMTFHEVNFLVRQLMPLTRRTHTIATHRNNAV